MCTPFPKGFNKPFTRGHYTRVKELKMEITKIERVAIILLVESKIAELKSRLLRERDGIAQTYIENDIAFYNALRDKLKDYE